MIFFLHYFCSITLKEDFMIRLLTFVILICLPIVISGAGEQDNELLSNNISDRRIKTVHLYKEGWNFSYPVIKLNGDEKLILQFDLIDNSSETYYYTFIHCDKDCNRSGILPSEYAEGFPDTPGNIRRHPG